MDDSSAMHPSNGARRAHMSSGVRGSFQIAIVKWFNRARGWLLTSGDGSKNFHSYGTATPLRDRGIAPGKACLVRFGMAEGTHGGRGRPLDCLAASH